MSACSLDELFIFEMANNHQGSVEHGLKIISEMGEVARKYKIRAGVKFQYRDLQTFIHPDYLKRDDVKHIPRFLSTRLSDTDFRVLVSAVQTEGMLTVCTPFDEVSVQRCLEHNIDVLKVASCSAVDWPLLEAMASTGKPTVISTGGLDIHAIDNIYTFFKHHGVDFALLHCVGLYPTPPDKLNLNFIQRLCRRFPGTIIGYSGHEAPNNTDVVQVAVAKGARILERHVGVPTETNTLNAYSMNPAQTDAWVASALAAQAICGKGHDKEITHDERESLLSLKRGVYTRRKIARGAQIGPHDVFYAMPCCDGQLDSGEFGRYRAKTVASKGYKPNEPVFEKPEHNIYTTVRTYINAARGLLNESGITTGDEIQIELSHHFGLENFRQVGAVLVTIVNRDYCKKLIIMLPGQSHPNHLHKQKEETFQLLWGDLSVDLQGKTVTLSPGDKLLVKQGQLHGFTSHAGSIFEEVSSRSCRNDSFYEDRRIAELDPMQRKTAVEKW